MHRTCVRIMLLLFIGFLLSCGGHDGEDEEDIVTESADTADTAEAVLTVAGTTPSNGSLGVPRTVQISVNFSEEVNPRTVTDTSFMVTTNDVPIPGTITWMEDVVTFTPVSPLAPNTTYTGRVTTAVRDLQENPLWSDFIWSFTTSSALYPESL